MDEIQDKNQLEEIDGTGYVEQVEIDHEMRTAYIDYSMSVIVSRALPDARDGLKPVQRRVLFGMDNMGLSFGGQTKKSARIVGEVMGKYHPHGDSSVYDAMVRLGQDWNQRYPLVKGQGNFGSVDGDSPAAMRYTEAKLQKMAEDVLGDMDKNTVDMTLNFDDTLEEPTVLPTKAPLLLLNGASGIAVTLAHCCQPVPGDAIVGFSTKVRGIMVHRENCPRVQNVSADRIIPVSWGNTDKKKYETRIIIDALNRPGIFADVAQVCANNGVNITSVIASQMGSGNSRMKMDIAVQDLEQLYSIIARLNGVRDVINVIRGQGS